MKKNRFLLLLTLILVIIAVLFVNRRYTTLDDTESGFAVADTSKVSRIFMVDKNNRSVELQRENPAKWILNGKYLAHNFNISMLLGTMHDITVRYPVPIAVRDNVIKRMASMGVKVEIYQEGYRINLFDRIKLFPYEKLSKTYYVGDATPDNRGTYILMEDAENPYVVFLPSLRGFIYPRFSTDETDWRDHSVFKTPLQDFASVTLEFLEKPEESFRVDADAKGNFTLTTLLDETRQGFDTLRMLQFVTAFKDIRFEAVLNTKLEASYIDSIASGPGLHIITLLDREGNEFVVHTFRKSGISEFYDKDGVALEPLDLDRMYAYVNEGRDFVLIQYFVFDKVLRTASYLQKKE
ncbi:MAG: DUF4340 domain-containing protein [Bacteroidetes bacterium]|nr:DUF4340 domain-containing protein [Bacteroidota bacterium]